MAAARPLNFWEAAQKLLTGNGADSPAFTFVLPFAAAEAPATSEAGTPSTTEASATEGSGSRGTETCCGTVGKWTSLLRGRWLARRTAQDGGAASLAAVD